MSYRVLILDDNYSFVDTLKMRWKSYPFYFDTYFQYEKVEENLIKKGPVINYTYYNKVKKLLEIFTDESIQTKEEIQNFIKQDSDYIHLKNNTTKILDPNGYFLVVIEYYAQNNINAFQFVQSIVEKKIGFEYHHFIILCAQKKIIQEINQKKLTKPFLAAFEKNMSQENLHQYVANKLAHLKEEINAVHQDIKIFEKNISNYIDEKKKLSFKSIPSINQKKLPNTSQKKVAKKNTTTLASKNKSKKKISKNTL